MVVFFVAARLLRLPSQWFSNGPGNFDNLGSNEEIQSSLNGLIIINMEMAFKFLVAWYYLTVTYFKCCPLSRATYRRHYSKNVLDNPDLISWSSSEVIQGVFLYCCSDRPSYLAHLNSIGCVTWIIWAALNKYIFLRVSMLWMKSLWKSNAYSCVTWTS